MFKPKAFLFFLFLFGFMAAHWGAAFAAPTSKSRVYLGAGLLNQGTGKYATTDQGTTSLLGSMYTELSLTGEIPIFAGYRFSPRLGYTPLGYKGPDTGEKSFLMPIALRLERDFILFEVHAGPGLWIYKIGGSGGTATLNNGTSTAVFGLPDSTQTTTVMMLDLGAGAEIMNIKASFDLFLTGFMSSKRTFNLGVSVSYGIL